MLKRITAGLALSSAVLGGPVLVAPAHAAPATHAVVRSAAASCSDPEYHTSDNYEGLYAGYSWAWNVVVSRGDTGDRVREIQCLLKYEWFINPGTVDGVFGSDTEQAVETFQRACPLPDDGIVGPQTWRCLRAGGHK
ncbi:peptidoglycan-binding domain-containing protein [Streptomyces sennicomposti]